MEFSHYSVMLSESIEGLAIRPDGIYVDGTAGGAGHSCEIAKRLTTGKLFALDKDPDAVNIAGKRLSPYGQATVIQTDFKDLVEPLKERGITGVDGILLDLGVSSYQLDTAERGFSYMQDARLDMRMDQRQTLTARDIVNGYSERELFRVIRDYGEDQFAKNIAKHIVKAREEGLIETTFQLNEIIKAAIPAKMRVTGGHPSKKTFQAIRIECNRELEVLKNTLDDMVDLLNPGGRLCIITFHSLEDRLVKSAFRKHENPCTCPSDFPVCVCGNKSKGKAVTRKPILPSEEELEANSRSKSAKLRVFEKAE